MNEVNKRAWGGLVFFILAIGLILFIVAGTVFYWQGWVYLSVFSLSVIFITYYLMKKDQQLLARRLDVGTKAEKENVQKIIQFLAQFAFIGIFFLPALDHRFVWSSVSGYLSFIADIFVGIGFYIVFLTFKENTFTSAIIEVEAKQTAISTGPYALVRHPMYSGALLMLFVTPIALGSWWGLVAFIPMLYVIIWRLFNEERYLTKHLPGYKEYCQKVTWHLVPFIF